MLAQHSLGHLGLVQLRCRSQGQHEFIPDTGLGYWHLLIAEETLTYGELLQSLTILFCEVPEQAGKISGSKLSPSLSTHLFGHATKDTGTFLRVLLIVVL